MVSPWRLSEGLLCLGSHLNGPAWLPLCGGQEKRGGGDRSIGRTGGWKGGSEVPRGEERKWD